jgi:DNA-binding response OmpR family regulator
VPDKKPVILIVEDDLDVADMLGAYFRVQGYETLTANWGEEGVRACSKILPNLIILDIRLPDIDGYEVAKRIRGNRRTKEIPIIFLTEKRARQDKLHGLSLGADDYITKPFDVQELRLRVRNALRRSSEGTLTNPVTGLPEGKLVDEKLEECLLREDWAILLISLMNFDRFRESYGFVASDDVLRAISLMIHNAIREVGSPVDFLGQLTSTDFLLVIIPGSMPGLVDRIRPRLEQSLDYFYPLKDRERVETGPERLAIGLYQFSAGQLKVNDIQQLKNTLLMAINAH